MWRLESISRAAEEERKRARPKGSNGGCERSPSKFIRTERQKNGPRYARNPLVRQGIEYGNLRSSVDGEAADVQRVVRFFGWSIFIITLSTAHAQKHVTLQSSNC